MLDMPRNPFTPGPPRASRILRPGGGALPANTERYTVAGGGAMVLELRSGDRVLLTNIEGGQACEATVAHKDGTVAPAILGRGAGTPADGLRVCLSSDEPSLVRLRKRLEQLGANLNTATSLSLFSGTSPAGDKAEFSAQDTGLLIVAAPAEHMDFDKQDTATPIEVRITRADPQTGNVFALPDPLADPAGEFRVHAQTAESYTVGAGEYIQIIDVSGRQCTDFQCFSARKLDRGIEHPLDATTTRTLVGQSYPMPGLFSKGFDQEMEPLVEVIQDTCGRHDAFALACTARYYDDIGYPGHVNCSDNFNGALEPYGVTARKGWMALNFFYNTMIDDHGALYLDEPWSRPGDYVLLRALTDLVCVSSACPDDVDPANGWNPTDIHVRTYSGKEKFSRAVAFRATPEAEPKMTKETGFAPRWQEKTRNFVEYRGFWLPGCFAKSGPVEEYWACRERAVVTDLSPLRKFEVTGPDAEALMQYTLTRNVRRMGDGDVVYSAMCYEHGGMLDDGTLFRLGPTNFRWIGGDEYGGEWLREQAEKAGLQAWVRSSTDQMHNIAVQGPKSRDILKDVIWTAPARTSIEELGWFKFTVGRIGGFDGAPVVVSRTGYTGELGYEVFCHPRDALTVLDAVMKAGEPHGILPMGLDALDMVRIEAGLIFFNYEFNDQTDPFEAGIGFTVPLKSKDEDFIGREALQRRKAHPKEKLVGLVIEGNDDVSHGDCVHVGRAQIGTVTSAMRSPLLKQQIALARLDVVHADIGTRVEVGRLDGHQKRLPAEVTRFPHYDPEKKRPRS